MAANPIKAGLHCVIKSRKIWIIETIRVLIGKQLERAESDLRNTDDVFAIHAWGTDSTNNKSNNEAFTDLDFHQKQTQRRYPIRLVVGLLSMYKQNFVVHSYTTYEWQSRFLVCAFLPKFDRISEPWLLFSCEPPFFL